MGGTIYDKIVDGVRYTPGHQTMINVKNPKGQIVASIQVNGTWGASACDPDSDNPKLQTGGEYTLDVHHQEWQPLPDLTQGSALAEE